MEKKDIELDVAGLKAKLTYLEKSVDTFSENLDKVNNIIKDVATLSYQMGELTKSIEKLNARIEKIEYEKEQLMKEKDRRLENNKNEAIMSVVRIIISAIVGGIIGKNYI